jgi:anti-sigma factor RsiW
VTAGPCLGDLVAALVDGELDHAGRERAQRHLAHCATCRAEVEAQRRLKSRMRALGVDAPMAVDALTARLLRVALEPTAEVPAAGRTRPRAQRQAALSATALVLLGVGAAFVLGGGPGRERPTTLLDPGADAFVADFARAPARAVPTRSASLTTRDGRVERLRGEGWTVPAGLPDGFRLLDARTSSPAPGKAVLHLAYSDGRSTVALFAQEGQLGTRPPSGFTAEQVGARPVWRRADGPERAVWSGGGHVWTLVSDAEPAAVTAAVGALPRDAAPEDGVRSRMSRGLGRIAGMLSPFD